MSRTEKQTYQYEGPTGPIELRTYTKSEARALIKKKLGIRRKDRLPVGVAVRRV